ncbi:hypothetical protein BH23CHL8_BH23CHL8_15050 [soil metagenome]
MRRALPVVIATLCLLLLASALPVHAADLLFRDGFENGLGRWQVTRPADATVRATRNAARDGRYGLRVASPADVTAGVAMRAKVPLARAPVAFDVRRGDDRAARLLSLHGPKGAVLKANVTASGRLRLVGRTWSVDTAVRLPRGRWVRLTLAVDVDAPRITVLTNGRKRQTLTRRTGTIDRVRLAGGAGLRTLSFDRYRLTGQAAQAPVDGEDPGPDPSPTPDPTPTPTPTYRFEGRGSDHGVGMSQAGAVGRAKAGQGFRAILGHYYKNTSVETRPVEGRTVRVLIVEGEPAKPASPFKVCGRKGRWTLAGIEKTFPRGSCADFSISGGNATVKVSTSDGDPLYSGPGADRMVEPAADQTLLQVPSRGSRDLFRGSLRVLVGSGRARVVNHLSMGDYLRGVVPLEMSSSRPLPALKAQAVAARSYAFRKLTGKGAYDLHDDTRHQAYGGAAAEASATNAATADTAGMVVVYDGKVASTLYHAHGGGATEHSRNVFTSSDGSVGTDTPYLRGSADVDPSGTPYDQGSAYDSWRTGTFTLAQLSKIMGRDHRTDVGAIKRLRLDDRGISGRLTSVRIVGVDGTRKKVAGWYFKSVYNEGRLSGAALLSTLFDLVRQP